MSLKIRLVLILSAVLSVGIALGAAVLLLHARAAMRSEMDTTLRLAERLISAVRSQIPVTRSARCGRTSGSSW